MGFIKSTSYDQNTLMTAEIGLGVVLIFLEIKEFIETRSFLIEERIVKVPPTNVTPSVILEGEDYSLKVSITTEISDGCKPSAGVTCSTLFHFPVAILFNKPSSRIC